MEKNRIYIGTAGFTLLEVMITLVVTSVLMIGLYVAYDGQQKSYQLQEQVGEMQQNNRSVMTIMLPEIRMAAFGSASSASCGAPGAAGLSSPRIHTATAARFGFSMDLNGDGDCSDANENVTYGFSNVNDSGVVAVGTANGIAVNGAADLGRSTGSGALSFQAAAENISAIEFNYILQNGIITQTPTAAQLNDISEVQVSILSRTEQADTSYINKSTYTPASGVAWDLNGAAAGNSPDDNFRRRLLTSTIKCRNMGI